jgi:DNA-binding response OmpR family regulator
VSDVPLVLVVEDEYPLQGEEALREGGFETAILSSGEEALTLFRGRVAPYRALVTDVNLKGSLSGWDVASKIREIEAAFPVIYMTGVSADQWTSHGVPDSILLRKPFAPAQLVTAVSQLLNPQVRQPHSPARGVRRNIFRDDVFDSSDHRPPLSTAPVADSKGVMPAVQ